MTIPTGAGTGGDLSVGPALARLRRDNALIDDVHDASEDEPHIVGIPKKFRTDAAPRADAEPPHS